MQTYSDPTRADSPTALPDVEVFCWPDAVNVDDTQSLEGCVFEDLGEAFEALKDQLAKFGTCEADAAGGWYWWSCFPGCLPDGDPMGPFETEAEAVADAQDIERVRLA